MTVENENLPWVKDSVGTTDTDIELSVTPGEATLVWDNPVDLSTGMCASAYGIKLVLVDGVYKGTMSAERAAVELSRSNGPTFTEEKVDE